MLLTTWQIIKLIIWGIILINEIAALYTVFREKRDIAATWAWLLVLTLIPVLGFILYASFWDASCRRTRWSGSNRRRNWN